MTSIKTIFTNIANAIRTKKGTSAKYLPENMAKEILTIETGITPSGKIEITNTEEINVTNYATAQIVDSNLTEENIKEGVSILGKVGTFKGGGDTTQEDGLITGEITSYTNDRITKVREYAFSNCSKLTSVNLPNVTSISTYSFGSCSKLINVNLPNLTSIGYNAFNGCSNLTNVNFPNLTSAGYQAFYKCSNLTSVNFPNVTYLGDSAFSYCSKLTSVNLPNVTKISYNTFYECSNLTSVNILNVTSINNAAFQYCYSLLKLVIAQTTQICTLSNTSIFYGCYHFLGTVNSQYNPEGLKDGYIYVPASLLSQYKVYTNWVTYESQIIGHEYLEAGASLPDYTTSDFTTQTWYSDEKLTNEVTEVATSGTYYCKLEA